MHKWCLLPPSTQEYHVSRIRHSNHAAVTQFSKHSVYGIESWRWATFHQEKYSNICLKKKYFNNPCHREQRWHYPSTIIDSEILLGFRIWQTDYTNISWTWMKSSQCLQFVLIYSPHWGKDSGVTMFQSTNAFKLKQQQIQCNISGMYWMM